ncbi:MAG: metallophosphatase family protein [Desulforhopalus sp.]|nr:metallophosphatase family protein [Desulforhopalus sp.]
MKIAVVADIHGNLEALEAVNADLLGQGVDRVICLGDSIGYGPDPEAVVTRLRSLGYQSVLGNHELALADPRARRWMNFQAADNNIITATLLSEENRSYCCSLPTHLALDQAYFVHGFPPDSVFRYLSRQSDDTLATLFTTFPHSLLFLGHTHKLAIIWQDQGAIIRRPLGREHLELLPGRKYVVNAGSVGQPRDGDNCAKYLLWDCAAASLEVRFVAYDYHTTMRKIRERGFPETYATRLG